MSAAPEPTTFAASIPACRWYILDVREAFGVQQFVGDILGGDADAGDLDEPDAFCLRWRLGGHRRWAQSEEPRRPCKASASPGTSAG